MPVLVRLFAWLSHSWLGVAAPLVVTTAITWSLVIPAARRSSLRGWDAIPIWTAIVGMGLVTVLMVVLCVGLFLLRSA